MSELQRQRRRDKRAAELAESFLNGNRGFVVAEFQSMTAEHAAVITAKICCILPNPEDLATALAVRTRNDLPHDDDEEDSDDETDDE